MNELLTEKEIDELFKKYELDDPLQDGSFDERVCKAQIEKLKRLGWKSPEDLVGYYKAVPFKEKL